MEIGPNRNGVYVKHGYARTRIDNIYCHMIRRCYSPKSNSYKDYGAKGIEVCDEWKNNKIAFFEWAMSNGYSDELSIDRIDVKGNYCPNNCRWVDMKTQQNNRSNNHVLEIEGATKTVAEWSEISGVLPDTIYIRLKHGWSPKDAVFIETQSVTLKTCKEIIWEHLCEKKEISCEDLIRYARSKDIKIGTYHNAIHNLLKNQKIEMFRIHQGYHKGAKSYFRVKE